MPSFSEAIRRALRQDPDVILVGEMRDLETIEAAITAAETGHIVFGTLHTTGAQGTVNRIIDVFPTNQQDQIRTQLSTAIIGMLVAGACCRRSAAAAWRPTKCWWSTPAIANLIRENKTFRINSAIQTGAQARHEAAGRPLVQPVAGRQVITKEDVLVKANSAGRVEQAHSPTPKRGMFDDDAGCGDERGE